MRVIVADDAVLFREGLARILAESGVDVVAQTGDGESLVTLVDEHRPEAVLVDIKMPPTHTTEGLDAAIDIRERWPHTVVLVLSQYVEADHAIGLLRDGRGGVGYLLKERVTDVDTIAVTLERLRRGESVIDPEVVALTLGNPQQRSTLTSLTEREREVLALIAEGRSNLAISQAIHLSSKTVETHIRSIFLKLDLLPEPDAHRRVLAVLAFLQR